MDPTTTDALVSRRGFLAAAPAAALAPTPAGVAGPGPQPPEVEAAALALARALAETDRLDAADEGWDEFERAESALHRVEDRLVDLMRSHGLSTARAGDLLIVPLFAETESSGSLRRSYSFNLAGTAIAPAQGSAPGVAAGSHPVLVEVDGPGHFLVDGSGARRVHRDRVPEVLAGPQPEPVGVYADNCYGFVRLVRTWESPEAVAHCRLCPACHAYQSEAMGRTTCLVFAPRELTYREARMFRVDEDDHDGVDQGMVQLPFLAEEEIRGGGLDDERARIDFEAEDPDEVVC
jgi:hypothetical protein